MTMVLWRWDGTLPMHHARTRNLPVEKSSPASRASEKIAFSFMTARANTSPRRGENST